MKLATIRTRRPGPPPSASTRTAPVELGAADLGDVARPPGLEGRLPRAPTAPGTTSPGSTTRRSIPRPEKVFCVGLNYRTHILEMGRELPEYPTLFAKFARALIGAYDPIELPAGSRAGGLGGRARRGDRRRGPARHPEEAAAAIAGYTVVNDVTARDFQYRSVQWLQGKTFERSTPVGPWLVVDEDSPGEISCRSTATSCRRPTPPTWCSARPHLVAYISQFITLVPGDIIATGTPGGVGHARKPPRYLTEGIALVTRVEGLGEQPQRHDRQGSLRMRVAVAGGGPGGLFFATLHAAGRPVGRGHRVRAQPGRRHVRLRRGVLRPDPGRRSTRPTRCCARRWPSTAGTGTRSRSGSRASASAAAATAWPRSCGAPCWR